MSQALVSPREPAAGPVRPLRVLELYCGIGGCAAALAAAPGTAEVAAALDVNHLALDAYRANFPEVPVERVRERTLESLSAAELAGFGAGLWWLSPPCQPFTRRGRGRDLDDPRSASLAALVARLGELGDRGRGGPAMLALENVPGFAGSRAHALLREVLAGAGYAVRQRLLCPSELGVPNRRRRFYLVASRCGFATSPDGNERGPGTASEGGPAAAEARRGTGRIRSPTGTPDELPARPLAALAGLLDPDPDPDLWVDAGLVDRYRRALDLVDPTDPAAVTACFTAAYGRSPVRSGSYLLAPRSGTSGVRRFSPAELLRLLGFPPGFRLPPGLGREQGWRLAGNSLSVPAVRAVLAELPGLAGLAGPTVLATA